jgi:hypothetical protein
MGVTGSLGRLLFGAALAVGTLGGAGALLAAPAGAATPAPAPAATTFDGTCTFTGYNNSVPFTQTPEVQFDGYGTCTGSVDGGPSVVHPTQEDFFYSVVPLSNQQFGPFLALGAGSADIYFNDLCPPGGPTCASLHFALAQVGGATLGVAGGLGYATDPAASRYGPAVITFHTVCTLTTPSTP